MKLCESEKYYLWIFTFFKSASRLYHFWDIRSRSIYWLHAVCLFLRVKNIFNLSKGWMSPQIFILLVVKVSNLKHVLTIDNMILAFIVFMWIFLGAIFRGKRKNVVVFLQIKKGKSHIYVMNGCKIRLSNKTHSKTLKF